MTCSASSDTMEASQPERKFSDQFYPDCLPNKACSGVSRRVSPSRSGGQPRAVAIACVLLAVSGACLTSNSTKVSYTWLRVSFKNLCLLGQSLSTHAGYLCSNSFHLFICFVFVYSKLFVTKFSVQNSVFKNSL